MTGGSDGHTSWLDIELARKRSVAMAAPAALLMCCKAWSTKEIEKKEDYVRENICIIQVCICIIMFIPQSSSAGPYLRRCPAMARGRLALEPL